MIMANNNSKDSNGKNTQDWGDGDDETKILNQPAYTNDRLFYRIVSCALSIVIVLTIVGGIWLAGNDKEIPDAIIALGSTAVGALAGVLAGTKN